MFHSLCEVGEHSKQAMGDWHWFLFGGARWTYLALVGT